MSACNLCGGTADFAVHLLISTRGARPRSQKCSSAVLFCTACIQAFYDDKAGQVPSSVADSLRAAYTAVTGRPSRRALPDPSVQRTIEVNS